ncbi:hypothetical protein GCM10025867_51210 (plasmid) [Frondihabitans sucicola]|uniref:Uncharacterized protein n=1 Tax=Frondihabitans sucicola TaxID=1268041 RepID=A0ABM8GWN3_9MICO|nr:hypothetical protein [Frondihabitans sucicola]BDZ52312.1 hypothetical protein GCM10025867_45530 [Frondihabitans sucicola]BDZ52880.1 hypothetical protein GCM10025867_51210 [Frondihabitans sucicola]
MLSTEQRDDIRATLRRMSRAEIEAFWELIAEEADDRTDWEDRDPRLSR